MDSAVGPIVLTPEQIAAGIDDVAARINARLGGRHDPIVAITVVPGGILMTADLVRRLTGDVAMDWISCPHTPGQRSNASPIDYHQQVPIAGRDVLVIDDAVESGGTMRRLVEHLRGFGPASLTVATLFVKPGRVDVGAPVVTGFELDSDEIVVGFGLPWEGKYRNLPHVAHGPSVSASSGATGVTGAEM